MITTLHFGYCCLWVTRNSAGDKVEKVVGGGEGEGEGEGQFAAASNKWGGRSCWEKALLSFNAEGLAVSKANVYKPMKGGHVYVRGCFSWQVKRVFHGIVTAFVVEWAFGCMGSGCELWWRKEMIWVYTNLVFNL